MEEGDNEVLCVMDPIVLEKHVFPQSHGANFHERGSLQTVISAGEFCSKTLWFSLGDFRGG